MGYARSTVKNKCTMWQAVCFGAYANNIKLCIPVLLVTLLITKWWYHGYMLHWRGIFVGTCMVIAWKIKAAVGWLFFFFFSFFFDLCNNVGSTCRRLYFYHVTKNIMVAFHFNYHSQGMQWCHWWWCLHHVMPVPTPMVSHDQKAMLHLISNFVT